MLSSKYKLLGDDYMKIIVIGDIHVPTENLAKAAEGLYSDDKEIIKIEWPIKDKQDFQEKALNIEKNGPSAEKIPDGLLDEIVDADMLLVHFAPIPKEVIERGKKLELIGTCRGGVEHIDVAAATKRNIPVIHVIRNAEAVSDFTIGLIISETRNIARSHFAIKNGYWRKEFVNSKYTKNLKDQTVGLVGLGHIGKLIAKKLDLLGVNVLGYDPYVTKQDLEERGINVKFTTLENLFMESDIISLHLRLTKETESMINEKLISLMKPSSYLINTSRAGVLDEKAIIEALQTKKIAGAALDVFWQEPLPENHPLLNLDNVTLTSHLAGDTVDAIPKSPFLLKDEINNYLIYGRSDLIVNAKYIKL
jgi:D-3-phosphoglycerate dehydrogenase / 2-oxoglutarate reductase